MCYVILIGDTFHRKTGAHSIIAIETHKGATFPGTVLIPQVPGTSAEQRGVTMLLTLIALIKPTDISKRTRIHFPSVVIDVFGSSTSYNGRALELRTVTARSEGASYRLTGIGQMDPPNEVLYLLESLVGAMLAHQDHGHRVGHSRDLRHCPCQLSSPSWRRQAEHLPEHGASLGSSSNATTWRLHVSAYKYTFHRAHVGQPRQRDGRAGSVTNTVRSGNIRYELIIRTKCLVRACESSALWPRVSDDSRLIPRAIFKVFTWHTRVSSDTRETKSGTRAQHRSIVYQSLWD